MPFAEWQTNMRSQETGWSRIPRPLSCLCIVGVVIVMPIGVRMVISTRGYRLQIVAFQCENNVVDATWQIQRFESTMARYVSCKGASGRKIILG